MQNDFDINKIREDFPILKTMVYGKPLVYFDNAATTQKPFSVINTIKNYYENENSNIHRGVHYLSELATSKYEASRKTIQEFLNAEKAEEIIFTRGTTESLNLFAFSFGQTFIKEGDEILISTMEHHSNIVPWQMLAERTKCVLKVIPINDKGEVIYEEFYKLLSEKTKLVSIVHISNSLGTINPIEKIIEDAHKKGIPVLVDAAQSVQHLAIDVRKLDIDFLAFSGHKIYGPTGIGILYGKKKFLDKMVPYQGGGDMILSVSFEKTLYNELPYKFEAGTPNICGAIALAEAVKYVQSVGLEQIYNYEKELLDYATSLALEIPELTIIGQAENKASVLSFVLENIHPHDIGTLIDREGIAVRTGHHCTEPVMRRYNLPATSRASFSFYNTKEEIDLLFTAIKKIINMFS